jgi:hypothetical protein
MWLTWHMVPGGPWGPMQPPGTWVGLGPDALAGHGGDARLATDPGSRRVGCARQPQAAVRCRRCRGGGCPTSRGWEGAPPRVGGNKAMAAWSRPAAPAASTSASSLEPVALPGGRPAAATAGPVGLGRPGGAGGGLGWPGRPGARSGRPGRRATPVGSGELVFGSMVATYQLDTRRQAPARACAQLFRANSIGQSRPRAEGAGPRAATHRARYCLGFRPPPKTLCQVCAHGSDPPREPNFQTNCRGPERPTVPGNWWPASEVIWKSTSIPASELVVRNEAPRRQPPPRAIPGERGACGPPVRRPQSAELHHLNRYAWA